MKWLKKGHQFDDVAKKLKEFRRMYIWGWGEKGKIVAESAAFLGMEICFIDIDESKQAAGMDQYSVISPETFEHERIAYGDAFIIVFAVGRYHYLYMAKRLLGEGYRENIDFFYYDIFLTMYLNILSVYKFDKVYIEQLSQMVTTYCSLRCRDCIISMPYQKERKHMPLEQLKRDADVLFSKVDFIKYYGPAGGEIFLYPELDQFLLHIIRNYSKQIGTILLITNATVLPNENVLKIVAENNLEVRISSYEGVGGWKEKRDKFVSACEMNGVKYIEQKVDSWINMGWIEQKHITENGARHMFERCDMPCRGFCDGSEYYCLQGQYANKAWSVCDTDGEELDFLDKETDKKTILEYNLGYSEKGYLGICAQCNGYFGVNQKQIPVAEQL